MSEYNSSEEFQRAGRDAFIDKSSQKKGKEQQSEKQKLKEVLDKHIKEHSSTKSVRAMTVKFKRSASYQLDLSADIVEILEKVKSDLR